MKLFGCVGVWGCSGWGAPQCVKETEIGGKCVKGPYPSVLHIFAEAAVGAWLTDEWGVQGWHTGGRALYYYISTAMLSTRHTTGNRKLNTAAERSRGLTKTNYVSRFLIYFLTGIFLLAERIFIKSVMSQVDFLKERNKYWKLKHIKMTAYAGNKGVGGAFGLSTERSSRCIVKIPCRLFFMTHQWYQ